MLASLPTTVVIYTGSERWIANRVSIAVLRCYGRHRPEEMDINYVSSCTTSAGKETKSQTCGICMLLVCCRGISDRPVNFDPLLVSNMTEQTRVRAKINHVFVTYINKHINSGL